MELTTNTKKAADIDEYISGFPKGTQAALKEVRATITKAVPGLQETISYAIPAFKHSGKNLLYFAGYKNHVGLYPVPVNDAVFEKDFAAYKTSGKGAIQFPLTAPMPTALIRKIVLHMLQRHLERIKQKAGKTKTSLVRPGANATEETR